MPLLESSPPAAAPHRLTFTLLRASGTRRKQKTYRPRSGGGFIDTSRHDGASWTHAELTCKATPEDLARHLGRLQRNPSAGLVAGRSLQLGKKRALRSKDTLAAQDLRVALLDVDGWAGATVDYDDRASIEAAIRAYVAEHLPTCFHGVRCAVLLSSSAGLDVYADGELKKRADELRCWLFYVLERPVAGASLAEHVGQAPQLDLAWLTRPAQIWTTSAPDFGRRADPLAGRRVLLLEGEGGDVVRLPAEVVDLASWQTEQAEQAARRERERKARLADLPAAAVDARATWDAVREEVKARADVRDLYAELTGERAGDAVPCVHPDRHAHGDRTPSASVYRDGFYCHGCGAAHDAIGLVQHVRGEGFQDALRWLASWCGVSVPDSRPPRDRRRCGGSELADLEHPPAPDDADQPAGAGRDAEAVPAELSAGLAWVEQTTGRPPDIERSVRYLDPDDILAATGAATFVQSPMGTGKTSIIEAICRRADRPVILVTHRRALASGLAARTGLVSYMDVPTHRISREAIERQGAPGVVIGVDSIGLGRLKLSEWAGCIFIADEATQVAAHVCGGTVRKNRPAIAVQSLEFLLRGASARWLFDADYWSPAVAFFARSSGLSEADVRLYRNTWRAEAAVALGVAPSAKQAWAAHVIAAVAAGRSVAAPIDSRADVRDLRDRLLEEGKVSPEQVLAVYADSDDGEDEGDQRARIAAFLADPNAHAPGLRVLLYSPTMGTGVDVSEHRFDEVVGYAGGTVTDTDVLQMLHRVRDRRDGQPLRRTLYVREHPSAPHDFDEGEIYQRRRHALAVNDRAMLRASSPAEMPVQVDRETGELVEISEAFMRLDAATRARRNIGRAALPFLVRRGLSSMGYRVFDAPTAAEADARLAELRAERQQKAIARILSAEHLDAATAEIYEREREALGPQERAALARRALWQRNGESDEGLAYMVRASVERAGHVPRAALAHFIAVARLTPQERAALDRDEMRRQGVTHGVHGRLYSATGELAAEVLEPVMALLEHGGTYTTHDGRVAEFGRRCLARAEDLEALGAPIRVRKDAVEKPVATLNAALRGADVKPTLLRQLRCVTTPPLKGRSTLSGDVTREYGLDTEALAELWALASRRRDVLRRRAKACFDAEALVMPQRPPAAPPAGPPQLGLVLGEDRERNAGGFVSAMWEADDPLVAILEMEVGA